MQLWAHHVAPRQLRCFLAALSKESCARLRQGAEPKNSAKVAQGESMAQASAQGLRGTDAQLVMPSLP